MSERSSIAVNGKSLAREDIACNFLDLHEALNLDQASHEADRCYYCYDAPCIRACPTEIDIPKFIHQIKTKNISGSAKTILSSNIMGGTCARACPTEVLCEKACVRNTSDDKPVEIGALQRYAVDHLLSLSGEHPFQRAELSGKKIAVVGAGPAGLSAAHRLAMLGHDSVIFEARPKAGGLNEYGLAAYKMVDEFAQREVEFLLGIGGIEIKYEMALGQNISLSQLQAEYDAVFIGLGLGNTNTLNIEGSDLNGVQNAVDFIAALRQSTHPADISVPKNVVVIGGGNTAIDAAVQAKRLGAQNVTIAYRRGAENMSATHWEQDLAKTNDVVLKYWSAPSSLIGNGAITAAEFNYTELDAQNKLIEAGDTFSIDADLLLLAVGQVLNKDQLQGIDLEGGKVTIDENYQTSVPGVYAGGDCIASGEDLTVQAVEDGKQAALRIDAVLRRDKAD